VWLEHVDLQANGDTSSIDGTTEEECLMSCANDLSCLGISVDMNDNPLKCLSHAGSEDFGSDRMDNQAGTKSYQLIMRCSPDGS